MNKFNKKQNKKMHCIPRCRTEFHFGFHRSNLTDSVNDFIHKYFVTYNQLPCIEDIMAAMVVFLGNAKPDEQIATRVLALWQKRCQQRSATIDGNSSEDQENACDPIVYNERYR